MSFADARSVLTTEQIQAIQVATQGKLLDPATEKSLRSVFVGNIPNDVTEEHLKEIFSQVGPVLSFRIVYDKESGKAKGYGFAEYPDQETAQSAMRNLNNYDLGGRILRVDHASSEKSKEELRLLAQAVSGRQDESPYGDSVEPAEAPEEISKAVASLPPEQMFELMRQMKTCIKNNPTEARTMLLQNPQLAYALLQAQVVMKIVDPKAAVELLHRVSTKVDAIRPVQTMPVMAPAAVGAPFAAHHPQPVAEPWRQMPTDPRTGYGGAPQAPMVYPGGPPGMGPVPQTPMGVPPVQRQPGPPVDPRSRPQAGPSGSSGAPGLGDLASGSDAEKAKVIQQVMKLTDAQINQLPAEQRQSIMTLRDQIIKTQQGKR